MVQCSLCRKHVHGSCDEEADPATYRERKASNPDYEYVCPNCKVQAHAAHAAQAQVGAKLDKRKMSEDGCESGYSASQESLIDDPYADLDAVSNST